MDKDSSDEGAFGKGHLKRSDLRKKLKEASSDVPGSTERFGKKERLDMEKEIFGKEYGEHITKKEYESRMRKLKKERDKAKTHKEKRRIEYQRKFLENLSDSDS